MAPLASLWSRRPSSVDQNIAITAGEDSYISVSESLSSTHTPSPLVQPGGQHCTSKTVISDSSAGIQTADGSRSEKIVLITVCNSSMPLQPENNDQVIDLEISSFLSTASSRRENSLVTPHVLTPTSISMSNSIITPVGQAGVIASATSGLVEQGRVTSGSTGRITSSIGAATTTASAPIKVTMKTINSFPSSRGSESIKPLTFIPLRSSSSTSSLLSTLSSSPASSPLPSMMHKPGSQSTAIAGASVGGIFLFSIAMFLGLWHRRRRSAKKAAFEPYPFAFQPSSENVKPEEETPPTPRSAVSMASQRTIVNQTPQRPPINIPRKVRTPLLRNLRTLRQSRPESLESSNLPLQTRIISWWTASSTSRVACASMISTSSTLVAESGSTDSELSVEYTRMMSEKMAVFKYKAERDGAK